MQNKVRVMIFTFSVVPEKTKRLEASRKKFQVMFFNFYWLLFFLKKRQAHKKSSNLQLYWYLEQILFTPLKGNIYRVFLAELYSWYTNLCEGNRRSVTNTLRGENFDLERFVLEALVWWARFSDTDNLPWLPSNKGDVHLW